MVRIKNIKKKDNFIKNRCLDLFFIAKYSPQILGHICEKSNPCENDAPCGYTRGGYICKCPAGWKGDDCDEG